MKPGTLTRITPKVKRLVLSAKMTRADLECLLSARMGFTYKTIAANVGLSIAQVGYRCKAAGISPTQYRRGESDLAKRMLVLAHTDSQAYFDTVSSKIRKLLKDQTSLDV